MVQRAKQIKYLPIGEKRAVFCLNTFLFERIDFSNRESHYIKIQHYKGRTHQIQD